MDDDLNSAQALSAVFVFIAEANSILDASAGEVEAAEINDALGALESIDQVLGIIEVARRDRTVGSDMSDEIDDLVRARDEARAAREWDRADSIRAELTERGIILEDSADGTRWKVTAPLAESSTTE
jgi:cysteinyl-tRNA synthetase